MNGDLNTATLRIGCSISTKFHFEKVYNHFQEFSSKKIGITNSIWVYAREDLMCGPSLENIKSEKLDHTFIWKFPNDELAKYVRRKVQWPYSRSESGRTIMRYCCVKLMVDKWVIETLETRENKVGIQKSKVNTVHSIETRRNHAPNYPTHHHWYQQWKVLERDESSVCDWKANVTNRT